MTAMLLLHLLITLVTLVAMEPLTAWFHRYVMHGFGWRWHRSHHMPQGKGFEMNDWYAVLITAGTIGLFMASGGTDHWLWWVALGITLYGALYTLLHEGIVHRRFPLPYRPASPWLQRLVRAHHLHHAVREKHGAVSYGFLHAPPEARLRAQLKANRQDVAR